MSRPNALVLSESVANRLFGEADPVGRLVSYNDRFDLEVTCVMDVPANSHLIFSYVANFESLTNLMGSDALMAALLLLIACVSFMNLATARSARSANEVGVRKAASAEQRQLITQFLATKIPRETR